jgi:hypothetical protein
MSQFDPKQACAATKTQLRKDEAKPILRIWLIAAAHRRP